MIDFCGAELVNDDDGTSKTATI
ncbi:hypothetical protein FP2506_16044 [Fulvimarina pelagi HTCC2506]|uniref:Uncharacterized protein n=1 Tax=Fulvimarina pelagi HTCC2506 TaxID=314231 RepID=Q0G371_9HYPH|nr:hypothetical protein FP2506_16044 [Fulvimarina pelagi HTCC2506]